MLNSTVVCRSNGSVRRQQQTDTCVPLMKLTQIICSSLNEPDQSYNKVNIAIKIDGVYANALIDTGSTSSHLSDSFRKRLKLKLQNSNQSIGLAVKRLFFAQCRNLQCKSRIIRREL